MMLVEEMIVPDAALPIDALRRHVRLGTGFAEDDMQEELLASFLRAAMSAIESRTGKALLQRDFRLVLTDWYSADRQPLPLAPVVSVTGISLCRPAAPDTVVENATLVEQLGICDELDPLRYRLELDTHVSCIKPRTGCFPTLAADQTVMIRFVAGMSPTFEGLPGDMMHAILMLAGHFDEYRNEYGLSQGCMPFGVSSLIARYCPMRLGFTS